MNWFVTILGRMNFIFRALGPSQRVCSGEQYDWLFLYRNYSVDKNGLMGEDQWPSGMCCSNPAEG